VCEVECCNGHVYPLFVDKFDACLTCNFSCEVPKNDGDYWYT
jgi:hypothetical protein